MSATSELSIAYRVFDENEIDRVYEFRTPTPEDVEEVVSLPFVFTFYRKTLLDLIRSGF